MSEMEAEELLVGETSSEQAMPSDREILDSLVQRLSEEKDVDVYLYAGPLERAYENGMLYQLQTTAGKRTNAILILETFGGHADAAYKIAKAFKRNYESFTVMVYQDCKSAGTLLCLGADHLVMADLAELGPLDVQIPKEGEFSGRRSGLDITDTLGALQSESIRLMRSHFIDLRLGSGTQISTRDALDNATKIVCGLLAPVYAQINPMNLGESARSNSIALHYGKRLSKNNLHPHALQKLISGYPSHGFVIDREEAEELFLSVREPDETEELVMLLLLKVHEELASRRSPLIVKLTKDEAQQSQLQESGNGTDPDTHSATDDGREGGSEQPEEAPPPPAKRSRGRPARHGDEDEERDAGHP